MKPRNWINLITVLSVAALGGCGNQQSKAAEPAKGSMAPAVRSLDAGRQLDMTMTATITSRTAKPGDAFTGTVAADVLDAANRVAIPAGSVVRGTITDVKAGTHPGSPGTLTLGVTSVTVRGTSYEVDASIDSLKTEQHGRPISAGDAARVGVGAAAGAIIGQVIGKNTRGTVIGAVVGAAAGAGYAALTKDTDIVLPAGTHVLVSLNRRLVVNAS